MAAEEFVEGEVEGVGDNEVEVFAVGGKLAAQQGGQPGSAPDQAPAEEGTALANPEDQLLAPGVKLPQPIV